MADAWMRTYPSGHRARITKSFAATFSLEVFTTSGDRVLDFALLMPSLELAKETADFIVNSHGDPWVLVSRESSITHVRDPQKVSETAGTAPTRESDTTQAWEDQPALLPRFRGGGDR